MNNETEITRTSLRLPKPLYDKLAVAAEEHGLTMHAEMLSRLEQSFDPIVMNTRRTGDPYEIMEEIIERVIRKVRSEEGSEGGG